MQFDMTIFSKRKLISAKLFDEWLIKRKPQYSNEFFAHIIRNKVYVSLLDFAILLSFRLISKFRFESRFPNTYLMITRKLFLSKWLETIFENESSYEICKKAAFLQWTYRRNLI